MARGLVNCRIGPGTKPARIATGGLLRLCLAAVMHWQAMRDYLPRTAVHGLNRPMFTMIVWKRDAFSSPWR